MGIGTVGMRVEFPHGKPSALSSVASTWILGIGWYCWHENSEILDSSSIAVSVHAWREPLAPLHLATHLFISHNISL